MNKEQSFNKIYSVLEKVKNVLIDNEIDYYSVTLKQHGEQKYVELNASIKIK